MDFDDACGARCIVLPLPPPPLARCACVLCQIRGHPSDCWTPAGPPKTVHLIVTAQLCRVHFSADSPWTILTPRTPGARPEIIARISCVPAAARRVLQNPHGDGTELRRGIDSGASTRSWSDGSHEHDDALVRKEY